MVSESSISRSINVPTLADVSAACGYSNASNKFLIDSARLLGNGVVEVRAQERGTAQISPKQQIKNMVIQNFLTGNNMPNLEVKNLDFVVSEVQVAYERCLHALGIASPSEREVESYLSYAKSPILKFMASQRSKCDNITFAKGLLTAFVEHHLRQQNPPIDDIKIKFMVKIAEDLMDKMKVNAATAVSIVAAACSPLAIKASRGSDNSSFQFAIIRAYLKNLLVGITDDAVDAYLKSRKFNGSGRISENINGEQMPYTLRIVQPIFEARHHFPIQNISGNDALYVMCIHCISNRDNSS
ncbi:MAG: hypothetical protein LBT64_02390, partial [Puniceicoccales bacterium]|nr:hypothetical protein [Puniceicoccales bacterium]